MPINLPNATVLDLDSFPRCIAATDGVVIKADLNDECDVKWLISIAERVDFSEIAEPGIVALGVIEISFDVDAFVLFGI